MSVDEFRKELENLINRACMENGSDTPDFILADYLVSCLTSFNEITKRRDKWHGFSPFATGRVPIEPIKTNGLVTEYSNEVRVKIED